MNARVTDGGLGGGGGGGRVLVLGAYGLIGSGVARRLMADGFTVTGLGRNEAAARAVLPGIDWVIRDLSELGNAAAWRKLLEGQDFVVNCAGALQDGGGDRLEVVHATAVAALAQACAEAGTRVVQISAVGSNPQASTAFLRSKAEGDAALRSSGARFWIFRPGLVLAPGAYGGSALLRMLAAFPYVQPIALPDTRVQTVGLQDVARAVSLALQGVIPDGTECDLVETQAHPLRDVVAAMRAWLGFTPARAQIALPRWTVRLTALGADALGRLGWRSPLRSSAVSVLEEGVTGDPAPWRALGQPPVAALDETLRSMPARAEDRLAARMALLMPLTIAVLFVFWLVSGILGFVRVEAAAAVLTDVGWPKGLATWSVVFWAVVDVAIAGALLVRARAGAACLAMVAVSAIYLVSATLTVPELWADPLGPLTKVVPGIVLALVARAGLETR